MVRKIAFSLALLIAGGTASHAGSPWTNIQNNCDYPIWVATGIRKSARSYGREMTNARGWVKIPANSSERVKGGLIYIEGKMGNTLSARTVGPGPFCVKDNIQQGGLDLIQTGDYWEMDRNCKAYGDGARTVYMENVSSKGLYQVMHCY